ncbi:CopD family protein [Mycobacterium sp. SMC-4]|uniref:CopD family protein n=1 Tax=Mycobacterium sp. SMC-4 TaxID=2857059 RepID=UPI0021B4802C|nr:CopD family protein [Mycobacterium sp. SMC-4]UXA17897.1 CopD family protein [Mycobacterium sp. SMC-4]
MTRRRTLAGALLITAVSGVLVWALGHPDVSLGTTAVRAVAVVAAVVTLGLSVVPLLDTGRHRRELHASAGAPMIVGSAVWLVAELARAMFNSASAAGTTVWSVGWRTSYDYLVLTAPGRAALLTMACAGLVLGLAVLGAHTAPAGVATVGAAAAGIVGHSLTGHLAHHPVGSVAVAAHALAAALWCGALAALVLTVEHRGRWSRVLPRFSQMSLWCVIVLLAGGILAGSAQLSSAGELFSTGYGRILVAKSLCTALLLALAWRHRTVWVPAARGHRSTAELSLRRAHLELAVMCVALTAAAALAVTG